MRNESARRADGLPAANRNRVTARLGGGVRGKGKVDQACFIIANKPGLKRTVRDLPGEEERGFSPPGSRLDSIGTLGGKKEENEERANSSFATHRARS